MIPHVEYGSTSKPPRSSRATRTLFPVPPSTMQIPRMGRGQYAWAMRRCLSVSLSVSLSAKVYRSMSHIPTTESLQSSGSVGRNRKDGNQVIEFVQSSLGRVCMPHRRSGRVCRRLPRCGSVSDGSHTVLIARRRNNSREWYFRRPTCRFSTRRAMPGGYRVRAVQERWTTVQCTDKRKGTGSNVGGC